MTQSQPLRSVSLCHRYVSSAPRTWSMTHPQSRSDHVPGNTTTPNFIGPASNEGSAGSPRNRRFRGVRIRRHRISSPLALRLEVESEVLDHMVREELAAHLLDTPARLVLARPLEVDLDVLADPNIDHLAKAKRGEPLLHRDPLWVVDDWLWGDDDSSDHGRRPRREIRCTGGPDARRGRAAERAHSSVRERAAEAATTQMGRMGAEDP